MSTFAEFIPPLVAFGTHARWRINRADASWVTFCQVSPHSFDPARDIVPFLQAIHECRQRDETPKLLPVPGGTLGDSFRPLDPQERDFAAIMQAFWPALTIRKPRGAAAYRWEVWAEDGTASFQRYDASGHVVPIHDLARMPLADLGFDLAISEEMDRLKKSL